MLSRCRDRDAQCAGVGLSDDRWLKLVAEAGSSARVVPSLDTGVVICDPKTGMRSPRRMLTLAEYCGWAKRMYERGAHGIYYFAN